MLYVELKTGYDTDAGPAWISRVGLSKSGRTIYFHGKTLQRVWGIGANHVDVDTGEWYWVSGPKRDRRDRRYTNLPVQVDEDVAAEYAAHVRGETRPTR